MVLSVRRTQPSTTNIIKLKNELTLSALTIIKKMALKYTDKVMDHFLHPRNLGEIENADAKVIEGNIRCGDQIQMQIKVDKETKVIEDVKFKSFGCASNIATASAVTELAKGKTIEEAKKIKWKQISDLLGGLPAIKNHCSVLAVETLHKAIKKYEEEK